MQPNSLISVIIPCHNASKYIGSTIDSILAQSYSNFELLIVDDGSTDNSATIIKSFKDERIKYFYQKNSGTCAATNFGISISKGDFIKFFDADDLMNPFHLEMQINRIWNKKNAIASCKWGRFYNDDLATLFFKSETVWKDMPAFDWLKASLMQKNDMMSAWLWLIPRNIINKAGFLNEQLTLNNDFEFSVRLLLNTAEVLFCEKAEVFYRSGNISSLTWMKTESAYKSVLLATDLGCKALLNRENSKAMRELCADRYKEWLFTIYPLYPTIQIEFESRIKKLGGSKRKMEGGFLFKSIGVILGWRTAKKIKLSLEKKL